ncbi:protein [Pseudescherichia vulneris]|nr:protein [Pseudescherichia vulneris]
MNEVLNSGAFNLASLVISLVVLVVGLVLWFFVNRASSRANEQIELLEALLDQQKRQNALLRRLCDANAPEKASRKQKRRQRCKPTATILSVWWLNAKCVGRGGERWHGKIPGIIQP